MHRAALHGTLGRRTAHYLMINFSNDFKIIENEFLISKGYFVSVFHFCEKFESAIAFKRFNKTNFFIDVRNLFT
uniref:Uncharacterized protein n=1 Tax=Romanomermis culicivorax TaxID=13658 RepID=A0A915IKI6_ROMCU